MKRKLLLISLATSLLSILLTPTSNSVTFPDIPKVSISDAPFLLNLWSYDSETMQRKSSFCSGTIVQKQYFITAAHCVLSSPQFIVVADQENQSSRGVPVSVMKWVVHPRYSSKSFQNDIAIGLLNFQTDNPENTIALPSKTNVLSANKYRTLSSMRLYGWGVNQNEQDTQNPMSVSQIDYSLVGNKFYKSFNLNTMIAGGKYNKVEKTYAGACSGDSGGPLIQNSPNGKKILVGITSYGSSKGCDTGIPTVYTRVSYYSDFIARTFSELDKEYEKEPGFLWSVDTFSKPLNSDEVFPVINGEFSNYSYTSVQSGGGVLPSTDIKQIMLQMYPAGSEDQYSYGLSFIFSKPYDYCVERQKGSWKIQMSLDSRQRVDLQFNVSPTAGCFSPGIDNYNLVKKTITPPSASICTDPVIRADKESAAPDSFIFFFSKGCLGNSKKIWIRVLHQVDGSGDLEPGYDMWAGPFATELPSVLKSPATNASGTQDSKKISSYLLILDKSSYLPGELVEIKIIGKYASGERVSDGTKLGSSPSDFLIQGYNESKPRRITEWQSAPDSSDISKNGEWKYKFRNPYAEIEASADLTVKLNNSPSKTASYTTK